MGYVLRWTLPIVVAMVCHGAADAATSMGRLNILIDVHGYDTGKGVVVPLRGIAEWLGAAVAYSKPAIVVTKGERKLQLTLGSPQARVDGQTVQLSAPPKVYGGIACVPVRFVAEELGASVEYVPMSPKAGGSLAYYAFVRVRDGSREAKVLVHGLDPTATTALIIAAGEELGRRGFPGRYGWDWIISSEEQHCQGYISTANPGWWTEMRNGESEFFAEGNGIVWRWRSGRWEHVADIGLDEYAKRDLLRAGVPPEVVAQLNL
ncbi:MAG: copper amine oxidase N-terminal domain-containing protein [Armatimonadetes bacterium]|nr:copper amine oxidase N-terminal domain-containing protein [Armatimonadota bacterium]